RRRRVLAYRRGVVAEGHPLRGRGLGDAAARARGATTVRGDVVSRRTADRKEHRSEHREARGGGADAPDGGGTMKRVDAHDVVPGPWTMLTAPRHCSLRPRTGSRSVAEIGRYSTRGSGR